MCRKVGGDTSFWNVGAPLPNYTASHPRRHPYSQRLESLRSLKLYNFVIQIQILRDVTLFRMVNTSDVWKYLQRQIVQVFLDYLALKIEALISFEP
jgi:hypothetical protein